jgi:hypothetical protein
MFRKPVIPAFVALTLALAIPAGLPAAALASPVRQLSHNEVRRAVDAGELLPLSSILDAVRLHSSLDPIEIRALTKDGIFLYEVLLLRPDGRVVLLFFDGGTAELVDIVGQNGGASSPAAPIKPMPLVEELFGQIFQARGMAHEEDEDDDDGPDDDDGDDEGDDEGDGDGEDDGDDDGEDDGDDDGDDGDDGGEDGDDGDPDDGDGPDDDGDEPDDDDPDDDR